MSSINEFDLIQSSGLFDEQWYCINYPDVRSLNMTPLEHFVQYGMKLNRNPGPNFSPRYYLKKYPDIATNKINPLLHYIRHGRKEGRLGMQTTSAGHAYQVEADENGNLPRPCRELGNGREYLSFSRDRQHFWYNSADVDNFVKSVKGTQLLSSDIRRVLVLAHDMKLTTGVSRSISHYLNAVTRIGGVEYTSIELGEAANSWTILNDIDAHDFVVVNSLAIFSYFDGIAELLMEKGPGKSAVYLHETGWGFDGFEKNYPERYADFCRVAPNLNFLCVSEAQRTELRKRFGIENSKVVYETTTLPEAVKPQPERLEALSGSAVNILMAGTIQPRKGVELFSKVADMANELGLPWTFRWAGWSADSNVYKSDNVKFLGNLSSKDLATEMERTDVFFLSSKDDPFPLACLEALLSYKRAIVYRGTGIAEIFDGISGVGVFEEHEPSDALEALKLVIGAKVVKPDFNKMLNPVSINTFVSTFNKAINDFWSEGQIIARERAVSKQKIAVVLHLYYVDLWDEIFGYLNNLNHLNADLFVTLSSDNDVQQNEEIRKRILKAFPKASIFMCPNKGMDIGPFVQVSNEISEQSKKYDLLLKIHSKKSLLASGEDAGRKWRKELFEGLMGSRTVVDQIVSIFEEQDKIGMIAPSGMLIEKSSTDEKLGKNANASSMDILADRMSLSDRTLSFFRGSMFWSRAVPIFDAIKKGGLELDEFSYGHQVDASKAHAMERLFSCIIRSSGSEVFSFNPEYPKPISFLKDAEKGKDIYVVAAGASCDHIDPSFFNGKCVVGVNRVFARFRCDYVVYKEYAGANNEKQLLETECVPVISRWHSGNICQGMRRKNVDNFKHPRYHFFNHRENQREIMDLSVIDRDSEELVVSYSTITSAIHFAAYLGARNIIIVGHDCGMLDGKAVFSGYYDSYRISPWKNQDEYRKWLNIIETQTIAVRDSVEASYDCSVVSLNPFINFGLEGHVYERRADIHEDEKQNVVTPK